MEYRIVSEEADSFTAAEMKIERKVERLCKEGWIPQGGVSIASYAGSYFEHFLIAQAMVKNDKEEYKENKNYNKLL